MFVGISQKIFGANSFREFVATRKLTIEFRSSIFLCLRAVARGSRWITKLEGHNSNRKLFFSFLIKNANFLRSYRTKIIAILRVKTSFLQWRSSKIFKDTNGCVSSYQHSSGILFESIGVWKQLHKYYLRSVGVLWVSSVITGSMKTFEKLHWLQKVWNCKHNFRKKTLVEKAYTNPCF